MAYGSIGEEGAAVAIHLESVDVDDGMHSAE